MKTILIFLCLTLFSFDTYAKCNFNCSKDKPTRDGYWNNISPYKHAFELVSSPHPVRYGKKSERFEVRDGDCGGSDCTNPRYRSEIGIKKRKTKARIGQDIWYGWSFYNKNIPRFPRSKNMHITLGQWKMGGDNNPIFKIHQIANKGDEALDYLKWNWGNCMDEVCSKHLKFSLNNDVYMQLDDMRNNGKPNLNGPPYNWGQVCNLFSLNTNEWIDIVLNTNFSGESDGYLNIWVNDERKCEYKGQIVAIKDLTKYPGPNHRRGIYVSYTKRWDKFHSSEKKPTFIVYYDEFRVGKSREEVDIRIIEKNGGEPVD